MKYIKKKVIKGKQYYYFEYPLKTHNKRTTYTKYLGLDIPPDIKERFEAYFREIASITSTSVKPEDKQYFHAGIDSIELARYKYRMLNHELFINELSLFNTFFYILFVLNSNRSEGSKVTRKDIEKVIKKRIEPRTLIEKEVINSINTINFAFSKNMKWNEKAIKNIHKNLFWNIYPEIAGKYKKVNNIVNNSATTDWKKVHSTMKHLLHWYKQNKKKIYPPILALEFHWRFESIHPFEDGNGRVGRIILNSMLVQQGYAPVIFFTQNHHAYCNAINKAIEGLKKQLAKHFTESIKKTNLAIEKYQFEGVIKGGSSKIGVW
ncbi:Fic family protein [Candidatus Woesearchaeota archaeon]|nr:Fic family protein [Candidatus Woesearchaeota archaeon]